MCIRDSPSLMPYEKAPSSGAFLPASLMYFLSGEPMHYLSGVDTGIELRRPHRTHGEGDTGAAVSNRHPQAAKQNAAKGSRRAPIKPLSAPNTTKSSSVTLPEIRCAQGNVKNVCR